MLAARELGINFLDDARYNDETGTAPMQTGYSEVVFGELFRAAGWTREETIVANKLWWEFWPKENAAQELAGSLRRMDLDYVDLIYALPPPVDLGVGGALEQVAEVLRSGIARAWGTANWAAEQMTEASRIVTQFGFPQPVVAQLAYSVVQPLPVEDPKTMAALRECSSGVVASYVLAGGVLTGKYDKDPTVGRSAGTLDDPQVARARRAARELSRLAAERGVPPAALAVAFVLANPDVTSALVGATSPAQLHETAGGVTLANSLGESYLEQLRAIGRNAALSGPAQASP